MKKTRWYPCSIKPVRNGWYEIKSWGNELGRCFYYNKNWIKWDTEDDIYLPLWNDKYQWRGLTKPCK